MESNQQEEEAQQIDNSSSNNQAQMPENSPLMEKFSPFSKNQSNDIEISVSDPINKESGLTKYTVYNIKGQDSKNGHFDTYRRYNEFHTLRQILVQRWPGCFIPPIPSKKAIGNKDEQLIEDRKRHLNHFCHKMATIPYLYDSEEFQIFLRSKESDLTKTLEKLPKQSVKDIINKYKGIFVQLDGKEIDSEVLLKITNMLGSLRKIKIQLQQQRVTAHEIAQQKSNYNLQLCTLLDQLLPGYESSCFAEYIGGDELKMIFTNESSTPKAQDLRKALLNQRGINPFLYLYDMLCFEYRDCEAFIESISQKDLYEKRKNEINVKIREQQQELQNLASGKTTFKSFFSKGNNDAQKSQLEISIQQNEEESANVSDLLNLMTGILGFIEIDHFKETKRQIYYSVMKSISELESLQTQQINEMWNEIGNLSQDLQKKQ